MNPKAALIKAIEADQQSQVELLQALVRAKSPNPPGDCTAPARVVTDYLTQRGIPFKAITARAGLPNIVSEFACGQQPGPRVVLNAHMDVFPVGDDTSGWMRDPWSGDIVDGRVCGRGVVDMKSGAASTVAVYAHLWAVRSELRGSVALCLVSDEETGGRWGTKHLLQLDRASWGGDVMLSAEPTGMTIRFSEKGTLRMTATVKTKGAHGAYLNLSKGAIRTASYFITDAIGTVESMSFDMPDDIARHMKSPEVLAIVDKAMGEGTSTIIARPTVNVGTIRGGTKVNVIPDHCEFELDIRLPIGLTAEAVMAELRSITTRPMFSQATIEFEIHEAASNPSSFSTLNHPMNECLQRNARALMPGSFTLPIPSMGATDCKHYRYAGIPAYAFGCSPYSMAMVNESASIDEFFGITKVHAATAWDFLHDSNTGQE